MSKTALNILFLSLVLIPAQALVFNNLVLFNVAVPLAFIYIIVTLPVTYGANISMTIGFLTGLAVDILSDTPGVNAFSATVLAFIRRPVFHLYVANDNDLADQRSLPQTMGAPAFMKYALTMATAYCLLVFSVEAMQIFNISLYLMRIVCSSIFTSVLIYAIASINPSRREKRL